MVVNRQILQLLCYGLFLSSFLIILSSNVWDMSQRQRERRMDQEQEERKKLLDKMCEGKREEFSENSYNNMDHLIVDDKHGLIYCFVPKVGSSNLRKIMWVLGKGEPYSDPRNVPVNIHGKNLYFLKDSSKTEIKAKLKHYTKFLFVRDPFVCLISAYRNKFEWHDQGFYRMYGRYIISRFGKHSDPPRRLKDALALGIRVSFNNFIQFVLEKGQAKENLDKHWNYMSRLCHPCLIQYDFIGHQETMQEDTENLLRKLMLQNEIKVPPAYVNMTTKDSLMKWYGTVPVEDRRKLYNLYEEDFKLFGYKKPDEVLEN